MSGLRASSGAPAGVATTWTGPRWANSAMSGVVSTTSPRNEVWMTSENCTAIGGGFDAATARGRVRRVTRAGLFDLQHRQKCFLWNLDGADLLHALLSFLLLLEELPLARDVAAVALRQHILSQRLHRRAGDDLVADRGLDRDLKQLPRNELAQLVGDLAAVLVGLLAVDDDAERVHGVAVDQHVELHEVA